MCKCCIEWLKRFLYKLQLWMGYAGTSGASKEQNKLGMGRPSIYPFLFLLVLLPISEGKWAEAWWFLMWMRHFDIAGEGADQTSSAILNSGKQQSCILLTFASGEASSDQAGNEMLMFQRFLSSEVLKHTEIFVPQNEIQCACYFLTLCELPRGVPMNACLKAGRGLLML